MEVNEPVAGSAPVVDDEPVVTPKAEMAVQASAPLDKGFSPTPQAAKAAVIEGVAAGYVTQQEKSDK